MNLLGIRKEFVLLSGRYDLVSSLVRPDTPDHASNDWTDRGANKFIQAGGKLLDRLGETRKVYREISVDLATGAYTLHLPSRVRKVEGVALLDTSENTMANLAKKSIRWMRWYYGSDDASISSIDRGTPSFYAHGFEVISSGTVTSEVLKKVTVAPPADAPYTLKFECEVESSLGNDTSVSWWSERMPMTLVNAAQAELERLAYRNETGFRSKLAEVRLDVDLVDADYVEEETNDYDYPNQGDFIGP